MTDQPKPSAAALAAADAICKQHGMLPGGYLRDSLAEALDAFAATRHAHLQSCATQLAEALDKLPRRGAEMDKPEGARYIQMSDTLVRRLADLLSRYRPVATMLGVPIGMDDLKRISKEGP